MKEKIVFFWFRRDLRIEDNTALYNALISGHKVLPVFIFDTEILSKLDDKKDRRVANIYRIIENIFSTCVEAGSTLLVRIGNPLVIWKDLLEKYNIEAIYANADYEPYALERDEKIKQLCHQKGITFHTFKDQCIFEKNEITKENGLPYTVFTPYSRKWKLLLNPSLHLRHFDSEKEISNLFKTYPTHFPQIEEIGFSIPSEWCVPVMDISEKMLRNYEYSRDFPALHGTSRLSVHLRFGTISIRQVIKKALLYSDKFLDELIWRDFYMMILFHFPNVEKSFKSEYEKINWLNNEENFDAWCAGKTGYALVDAGMRQLNATGYMHNRLRMITASFLTKHLLIDWRWGERYFADKLLDFELASNNGGWQWAASTGCDAVPYFRIFNPELQLKKFDAEKKCIRFWIPEYDTPLYPKPIVKHEEARQRALAAYKNLK